MNHSVYSKLCNCICCCAEAEGGSCFNHKLTIGNIAFIED